MSANKDITSSFTLDAGTMMADQFDKEKIVISKVEIRVTNKSIAGGGLFNSVKAFGSKLSLSQGVTSTSGKVTNSVSQISDQLIMVITDKDNKQHRVIYNITKLSNVDNNVRSSDQWGKLSNAKLTNGLNVPTTNSKPQSKNSNTPALPPPLPPRGNNNKPQSKNSNTPILPPTLPSRGNNNKPSNIGQTINSSGKPTVLSRVAVYLQGEPGNYSVKPLESNASLDQKMAWIGAKKIFDDDEQKKRKAAEDQKKVNVFRQGITSTSNSIISPMHSSPQLEGGKKTKKKKTKTNKK
jgi:hypothetical protein